MNQSVRIRSLQYPSIPHEEWNGTVQEQTDEYVILSYPPEKIVTNLQTGRELSVYIQTIDYFSLHEWFMVSAAIEDNKLLGFYCKVTTPSKLTENKIEFVDLNYELLKESEQNWELLDDDLTRRIQESTEYSDEWKVQIFQALERVQVRASEGRFPFNDEILKYLESETK